VKEKRERSWLSEADERRRNEEWSEKKARKCFTVSGMG
jgi:hypothetical protein